MAAPGRYGRGGDPAGAAIVGGHTMARYPTAHPTGRLCLALLGVLSAPGILAAQLVGGRFVTARTLTGTAPAAHLGESVANVGDTDRDGVDDVIVGAIGFALMTSGANGGELWRVVGTPAMPDFGAAVAAAGDVDADGVPDVVVGASRASPGGRRDAGSALVYSGRDGRLLWRLDGAVAGGRFGAAVAGGLDADGDGHHDVVVGSPGVATSLAGAVHVFSGRTGIELWQRGGSRVGDRFGEAVAVVPDLDGDGRADVVVGAPGAAPGGSGEAGSVTVLSGGSGGEIARLDGTAAGDRFGAAVAAAGDADGDGIGDLVVGAPQEGIAFGTGLAVAFSGRDLGVLHTWVGAAFGGRFGGAVGGAGDVDADGHDDVVVGAPWTGRVGVALAGSASVWSGRDGALLQRFVGVGAGDAFGSSVAGAGDIDGDGFAEVVIGAPRADRASLLRAGEVSVHRLDPYLVPDGFALSAATGGTVSYAIAFPAEAARQPFVLMVSLGTGPVSAGIRIPLSFDPLFVHSFFGPLGAPLVQTGFRGTLSAQGAAPRPAVLVWPAGAFGGISGVRLYLAAVTFAGGLPSHSSVAVRLDILP